MLFASRCAVLLYACRRLELQSDATSPYKARPDPSRVFVRDCRLKITVLEIPYHARRSKVFLYPFFNSSFTLSVEC